MPYDFTLQIYLKILSEQIIFAEKCLLLRSKQYDNRFGGNRLSVKWFRFVRFALLIQNA